MSAEPARETYFDVYERALKAALANIVKVIPAADLSIQWDVCQEVWPSRTISRTGRRTTKNRYSICWAGWAMPCRKAWKMGYHLCYGSPRDEHLVQPKDSAILVEMMNGIAAASRRRIDFLHIPVPRERTDAAYYAPLEGFKRPQGTKLYLGLLHHDDAAGDARRIDVARRHAGDFGLSAECGWGRTEPGRLPGPVEGSSSSCGGIVMVERVLVVGPKDCIAMVDDLAPKGFEIVKALHNSPEMKAAIPGADYSWVSCSNT